MDVLYTVFIFPLEFLMRYCFEAAYRLTSSHGHAVVVLSIVVNIALLPLYYVAEKWKQEERSQRKAMEAELASIRKHSTRRERYYYTQQVYRRMGYHPLSALKVSAGLLIQIPFFFAAFSLLSDYPDWLGHSYLGLPDLGAADSLIRIGGISINALPILMTIFNLASAYLYAAYMDRSEKLQLWGLALFFLVVLYASPAGLVLYWTCNNLFSLGKNAVGQRLKLDFLRPTQASPSALPNLAGRTNRFTRLRDTLIRQTEFHPAISIGVLAIAISALSIRYGMGTRNGMSADLLFVAAISGFAFVTAPHFLRTLRFTTGGSIYPIQAVVLLGATLFLSAAFVAWAVGFRAAFGLHTGLLTIAAMAAVMTLVFVPAAFQSLPVLRDLKQNGTLAMAASFSVVLILLVANPLTLYVSADELPGTTADLAAALFSYFVPVALVIVAGYWLLNDVWRKAHAIISVYSLMLVVGYSNLLDVGLLDHFVLNQPDLLNRSGLEILFESAGLGILGLVACCSVIYFQKLTSYLCVGVLVASVSSILLLEVPDETVEQTHELPADHEQIVSFSRDRNVLVVMLDGFSGGVLQNIREENPESLDAFDGFTWYPNTLSTHSGTWGSIGALMGGAHYTVEAINKRHVESIESELQDSYSVLPDAFLPNGYDVTYINPGYSRTCDGIDPRVRCSLSDPYATHFDPSSREHFQELPNGGEVMAPLMVMVSLFKAAPMLVKQRIYNNGDWLGTNTNRPSRAYRYKLPEWGFLTTLANEANATSDDKTLKYISLQLPHKPNALNADCVIDPSTADFIAESRCGLLELERLFDRLKTLGVYDNSMILVVSDHGWWIDNPMFAENFSDVVPPGPERRLRPGFVNALLMVKDFGARGALKSSNQLMTNTDTISIVCGAIGACRNVAGDPRNSPDVSRKLTISVTDLPHDVSQQDRFDVIDQYQVENDIFNPDNWVRLR